MRVLFDSNVLIAAFITHGMCNEVFEHCLSEHTLCVSSWILNEVEEKLLDKFRFPRAKVHEVMRFIRNMSRVVVSRPLKEKVCRDPDDDNILAAAIGGQVECILTGDDDLLTLKKFRGIPIISPAEFWRFEATPDLL